VRRSTCGAVVIHVILVTAVIAEVPADSVQPSEEHTASEHVHPAFFSSTKLRRDPFVVVSALLTIRLLDAQSNLLCSLAAGGGVEHPRAMTLPPSSAQRTEFGSAAHIQRAKIFEDIHHVTSRCWSISDDDELRPGRKLLLLRL
jgi:hypothetical protein